jgi:hypothetical protein
MTASAAPGRSADIPITRVVLKRSGLLSSFRWTARTETTFDRNGNIVGFHGSRGLVLRVLTDNVVMGLFGGAVGYAIGGPSLLAPALAAAGSIAASIGRGRDEKAGERAAVREKLARETREDR